jgi:hypothetical protein
MRDKRDKLIKKKEIEFNGWDVANEKIERIPMERIHSRYAYTHQNKSLTHASQTALSLTSMQ